MTYAVEVEEGLGFDPEATAHAIDAVLGDERGWMSVTGRGFVRGPSPTDLRILIATPSTTDDLCAPLETMGRVSCRKGELVVINALRWAYGTPDYRGDLRGYRRYVINHEVGHALGNGHVSCPAAGEPAPVMLQQTYGLDGCTTNPWPTVAR